ncbi:unnamed protein product [Coregonus sp. 'balchen']|nr:unnamed protein product [Coregonus sp. 'balchen']
MDEGTLEAAITAYGAQLQQVESALLAGLDPSQQADLLKLKEDISQLIELTEASLVSVKKSRLLATLEEADGFQSLATGTPANGGLDNVFAAFYSEVGEVSGSSSDMRERGEEEEDDGEGEGEVDVLSGTKVRAPYRTSWGTLEYHNAMVVGTESCDRNEAQVLPWRDIDSDFYTVKFDSALLKNVMVEADGEDWAPSRSSSAFGGWEAHTRGIGSKLMLKMGYEYGKGLGKTSEGRVEPVLAVVLPKGKSLDQCAELTGRKTQSKVAKGKDGEQVSRNKRKRKARAGNTGGCHNVFDFLNRKLGNGDANPEAGGTGGPPPPHTPSSQGAGVEAYKGGKSTKRNLNVKLFQAAERVAQTEREIQKITESLSRRTGRDSSMVTHLEEKLSAARSLLVQQKAQELSAQRENRKADTHKKMTEF